MTAAPKPNLAKVVELSGADLRPRLREALQIYVDAMEYPPGTVEARAPMWLAHMLRPGWRCVGALDERGLLTGICYGYTGAAGQWWHDQVRTGLVQTAGPAAAQSWLADYFELTELHVRPDMQGNGLGESLLRALLDGVTSVHVLLSTPEGDSRAWRLYRRLSFADVLRGHIFTGDPRPFAVLGHALPLEPLSR
jgi:ribosomal protein S18 acetylase RimI-like enzyme